MKRIAVLVGSLREGSFNLQLVRAFEHMASGRAVGHNVWKGKRAAIAGASRGVIGSAV